MLDPTEQRIVGVLIEKELSMPGSYPLTENALLAGCNQKSNRDPEMALEAFQVQGAVMALRLRDWVARVEGGRAAKVRHRVEERLGVNDREKAVLAELLLRGPQSPGELHRRVARMGFRAASSRDVLAVLENLAARTPPLATKLPRRPREREVRWAHALGAASPAPDASPAGDRAPPAEEAVPATPADSALARRLAALEVEVAELRARLDRLESRA